MKEEDVDLGNSQDFLKLIVTKARMMSENLDTQLNIVIGLSSAMFVFGATKLEGSTSFPLLFLVVLCGISAFIGLTAIHPFSFLRRRGPLNYESVMFNKIVTNMSNPHEYAIELEKVLNDPHAMVEEYAKEIYNQYKYYYRPKRKLYKLARNILVAGIAVDVMVLVVQFFVNR